MRHMYRASAGDVNAVQPGLPDIDVVDAGVTEGRKAQTIPVGLINLDVVNRTATHVRPHVKAVSKGRPDV